ncbi:hypothetical protein ACHAXR_012526 [Thalassiosira sp. AJA248-18]
MMKCLSLPIITLLVLMVVPAASFSTSHQSRPRRQGWSAISASTTTSAESTKPKRIQGPPIETKPDYSSIHGPLGPFVDSIFMSLFRVKLAERLNRPDNDIRIPDSKLELNDFMGINEITLAMNTQYSNRTQVQEMAREVLVSLFPSFILDRYPSWFARPFPEFSARMCAWATMVGGTWLMGECEVNDVPEMENGGKYQGVLVKRCRFLEESQCASICVNSCKIPTQNFFRQNMGLALTMTPDYETGECQFAYGRLPTEEEEREARETPCLMRCPSSGGMRSWHNGEGSGKEQWLNDLDALAKLNGEKDTSARTNCLMMED